MSFAYSKEFYSEMEDTNLASARAVVPLVMDLVNPKSVVDIGCGTGLWLKAFSENGVKKILGIDGKWVDENMLVIPREYFVVKDLEKDLALDIEADLAVSLEVAEHLDASYAKTFVGNLTKISSVILFSAAIPFQGGSHHVNEQWPEYWAKLFRERGYIPVDCLRRKIWNDKRVSFFYAQNILVYIDEKKLDEHPKLKKEIEAGYNAALPLVHPEIYLYYAERWRMLVPFLGKLPIGLLHMAKRLLRYFRKNL